MMKLRFLFLLLAAASVYGQGIPLRGGGLNTGEEKQDKPKKELPKATIDKYRVFTIDNDTTYIDTSLTIRKDYLFNYLRRDNFGLLPFANDGQTYNTLDFGIDEFSPFPAYGMRAKHFNYMRPEQMRYYQVATPLTELYFKTTIKQGQSADAFIALNTSERFNVSLAYRGLRSIGRYENALSSTGNFRFTTNYHTATHRYYVKAHFTGQDFYNMENGGVVNIDDFESGNPEFDERGRLQVYLTDARSVMKGNRYFVDHGFRVNKGDNQNNLILTHQFNYEHEFFEYYQPNLVTDMQDEPDFQRFGPSYVGSRLRDKSRYNRMYNKVGAVYENKTLGKLQAFVEDFRYNYFYKTALVRNGELIPSSLNDEIGTFGGQYTYKKNNLSGTAMLRNSITDQDLTEIDVKAEYQLNEKYLFGFRVQKMNRLPNHNFNLFQSGYVNYNWVNDFNNEKITNFEATAETPWINASVQATVLDDYLYFDDVSTDDRILLVAPKQYGNTIKYLSVKASKEFRFGPVALDNTILYQQVGQDDEVLNVPKLLTRNTLYFSGHLFKKAMEFETGVTFQYFSKYLANDYNPLLGEFYVQHKKEIGDFPLIDLFFNARVRQTRIFLKAEHVNSSFTGNRFFASPTQPYKDFVIRFGLVWTFFQ